MSEIDEMMRMLKQQMQNAHTVGMVRDVAGAYDRFASDAMVSLLEKTDRSEWTNDFFDALAHDAWRIADAMMTERRARGLGGLPAATAPTEPAATGVPEEPR